MVSRSNICCSLARKCPDNKLCAGLVSRVARLWLGTASATGRLPLVHLDGIRGQGGRREAPGDRRSYPMAPTTPSGRRPGSTAAWRAGRQLTQLLRLAHGDRAMGELTSTGRPLRRKWAAGSNKSEGHVIAGSNEFDARRTVGPGRFEVNGAAGST